MERLSLGTGITAAMSHGQPVGRHGHVDALGRSDRVGIPALVERPHRVGPDAGGVDDGPGPDRELRCLVVGCGTHDGTVGGAVGARREADDGRVVGDGRPELEGRCAGEGERQSGVVGPGVEVEEAGHEVIGVERREMGEGLVLGDFAVPLPDAPPAREVVHPEGGGVRPGHGLGHDAVAAEEGDEKGEWADEMRGVVEQALPFGQVLVDEAELPLLEVAEAAVDHLRGLRRRSRREVALLDEGGPEAAAGGVERHACSGHATAHDEHVELLVGEASQRIGAAKGVHR